MTEDNNIFLIDICGTIFSSNTTMDFMRFHFDRTSWFQLVERLLRYRIVGFLNARIHRYFHWDIIRWFCIKHLKGYSEKQIQDMTKTYYDEFLSKKINTNVIEVIENQRKLGKILIIVSATLDCIAAEISNRLNIPMQYSSKLLYDNGICTGRLAVDLLNGKLRVLEKEGYTGYFSGVITDNYTDVDIIEKSYTAYLVQYKDRKNKWPDLLNLDNPKYISIII